MRAKKLAQAVNDYLLWMIESGYSQKTWQNHEKCLIAFVSFVKRSKIPGDTVFTPDTLRNFEDECGRSDALHAVRSLARYLYQQKRIPLPIQKKKPRLPKMYENYLSYYEKSRQPRGRRITQIRRVLTAFNNYLEKNKIDLPGLKIEQIDMFLSEFNFEFAPNTCSTYRYVLRGFLSYLYYERNILKSDFAPLIVGAKVFEQTKPPMFLRPHEVQRLFENVDLFTPSGLRTYAMLQLAYTLGLRPKEICRITLDDIEFTQSEIRINERKSGNPINLPLPEEAIKAIAAYIIGARPKSSHRTLFLSLCAPYAPISPTAVGSHLKNLMLKAGLPSTAYWLRHTYAQNLLEAGASICKIRDMMGHESIRSTQTYLRIHITLMREVLFNESI